MTDIGSKIYFENQGVPPAVKSRLAGLDRIYLAARNMLKPQDYASIKYKTNYNKQSSIN